MNVKKKIIITILIVALPLLIGLKLTEVELRGLDKSTRLVYLDEVLKRGGQYMAITDEGDGESEESDISTEETETTPTQTVNAPSAIKDESDNDSLEIKISGHLIYVQGKYYTSNVQTFKNRFNDIYDESKKIVLVEDYAEYLVFVEIMDYLNEQSRDYSVEIR